MSGPPSRHRLPFAPAHHCWSCGDPIDPLQAVGGGGVCGRFECRAAEVRRRQAEDRELEAHRWDRARDAVGSRGLDPEAVSWSVVPANGALSVPLSPERRDEFLTYLDRIAREAADEGSDGVTDPVRRRPSPTPDPSAEEGRFPPPGDAESRALLAGCAACRGWCCRRGGTHAFLTPERLARLLRERPGLHPGDLVDLYAAHLGEEHLRGGCVFQGEGGCRLPRELRGDRCNDYYCPDLVAARRAWRADRGAGDRGGVHHFAAVAPGRVEASDPGEVGARDVRVRQVALPTLDASRAGPDSDPRDEAGSEPSQGRAVRPEPRPSKTRRSTEGETMEIRRVDEYRWLVPRQGKMRVDGLILADDRLMEDIRGDQAVQQVANVAQLPGIVGRSIGMPDIHWGYGFAIGGVAAFDPDEGGVVSPGGVGYDINCGVRLLRTDLTREEMIPRVSGLMDRLYETVPAGVGRGYERFVLKPGDIEEILVRGAAWAVEQGLGVPEDLDRIEDNGTLAEAEPDRVSRRAVERGRDQVGTVGSGNHFIEVGWVDEVVDEGAASTLGLEPGTVTIIIHSGSRGLGYQVCDDSLDGMLRACEKYGIELPDKQLACAPLDSPEGRDYMGAMRAAANYAFANRQVMAHRVREAFGHTFGRPWDGMGIDLVYDVAHNIAKYEEHRVDGRTRRVCVHRKGATRAFPPGHTDIPARYRDLGQPVLIPGDMGRYSYVLLGTEGAFGETFGSTCHGAGRRMSRRQAKRSSKGRDLRDEFRGRGIEVRASSFGTVAEEVPEAYKDVADVVGVVDGAGIGRTVARLRPLGVLKG